MPPLPKNATCAQICEAWIRLTEPQLAEDDVQKKALAFFEASPAGELTHLFEARLTLQAAGLMESDWVSALPEKPNDGAICFLDADGKCTIQLFVGGQWHAL